ncbi:YciI family protein [Tuwongella immobilis]|uniref:YCII-related domain-containing protein n=1 Tax=Tuwongella immobilis TaxID=692036 RepID=A0A6C2YWD6_9BACT|nr:YciI family protein [Tuwongella immobilis]VIP05774.1 Uncharacterized protein OS=Tistrella mobilis (strain KA081020-065) GN=TMO_2939 PE=4 SV=1: YCII [Tuwongella immobilis]VTS08904.1 Uncharacterized protein OS=Tistrella mobilis (strain KA081020-065) GN=TMO_2939 PE=4 SV=1: YCII [Tuwongella immobilis]
MQYTILFYEPASEFAKRSDAAEQSAYWGAWSAYIAALHQSGVFVQGAGLMPPDLATTVSIRDDKRRVQDGPYADTKEQLGGFCVIDVPDLDAALSWAARSPNAPFGSTEVRPLLPPMNDSAQ